MKQIITLLLCTNFSLSFGQISLDSSCFPLAGISYNRFIAIGGTPGNAGSNQLYDFSNSMVWLNDTHRYISSSATPYASFHPGATVATVQAGGGITQVWYYSSDANAYWTSGATLLGDFGMGFTVTHANHVLPYTDTLISNDYVYGNIETEVSVIRFVNIYPGLDYQTTSEKYIACDGYGTLYAPLDTFVNVLRVKYIEFKYDTVFSNNVPADAKSDTLYYYKYFAQGIRHPVVVAYTNNSDSSVKWIEVLVMPDILKGCTDSLAQNFNPIANQDDGTCIYCSQINYSIAPDANICKGDTISLTATGATNFLWSTGDTVTSILVNPDSTQTYSVYMNYQLYCWQIATVNVSVYENVQAGFWPDLTNPNDGDTILFVNTSVNAINYFWDFGDSTTSTEENPRHLYATAGTKTVTLIASNPCLNDTFIMTFSYFGMDELLASGLEFLVYPNPFSTTVELRTTNLYESSNYELSVYDIYGKEVFIHIIRNLEGFVIHGGDLPVGIYFLKITTKNNCQTLKLVKQ